jgi:hypothetical protein
VRITRDLRAIRIESLATRQLRVLARGRHRLHAHDATFQGERIERRGTLWIPDDLLSDEIVVRAFGGPRPVERGEEPETLESLADVIDLIETIPSYERVTVELFAVDPYLSNGGEALYGVGEISHEYPGYVVYDEREARAVLFSSAGGTAP